MRKVYLSFLGAGNYDPAIYHINDIRATENIYVQCAELEILGKNYFDVCYFVMTPTSKAKHYEKLKTNLLRLKIDNIVPIEITNEWADAVNRLVEDADAHKMGQVAGQTTGTQISEFNDEEMIVAFDELTNSVRNVDVNNIALKANSALDLIKNKEKASSITDKILLNLVIDKFTSLTTAEPISGNYDKAYFSMQIEIIRLLLEHKLFMQAYTVMREFIGSIGLIEVKKANMRNKEGRKQRRKSEIFINMLTYDEKKWKFKKDDPEFNRVRPLYEKLKTHGIEPDLRKFCKSLTEYRNGFDHAWTSKAEAFSDIKDKGNLFLEKLINTVSILENKGILM